MVDAAIDKQTSVVKDLDLKVLKKEQSLSIVLFSGDFDKAVAAFTLATGGAATNRKVSIFFTFWGINLLKKDFGRKAIGKGILAKVFNFLMGGRDKVGLSRLNFGGLSPKLMERMMKKNNVATLNELIEAAIALDIPMTPCEMSMQILGVGKDDLIPQAKSVVGVSTFLDMSKDAQIIFI
jgi:peroxiredoxin family protein